MKKVIVKFKHTDAGTSYPAGSILAFEDKTADWLCSQKIDDQPCAVLYAGDEPALNVEAKPKGK